MPDFTTAAIQASKIKPGYRFGTYTVVSAFPESSPSGLLWECKCDCGRLAKKNQTEVRQSRTKRCRQCADNHRRQGIESYALKKIHNQYVQRARANGHSFELSHQEMLRMIKAPCFYCGAAHSNTVKRANLNEEFHYNGIDRVDSSSGYTNENIVTACGDCNTAKSDLTKDEFLALVRRIANHLNLVGKVV